MSSMIDSSLFSCHVLGASVLTRFLDQIYFNLTLLVETHVLTQAAPILGLGSVSLRPSISGG